MRLGEWIRWSSNHLLRAERGNSGSDAGFRGRGIEVELIADGRRPHRPGSTDGREEVSAWYCWISEKTRSRLYVCTRSTMRSRDERFSTPWRRESLRNQHSPGSMWNSSAPSMTVRDWL